jgi:hypothetical protein
MGSSYSSEKNTDLAASSSSLNKKEVYDIKNKIQNIIETEHANDGKFDSDTLGDITEIMNLAQQKGGHYKHNSNEVFSTRKLNRNNNYDKYNIKNIMGNVQNKVLTAGGDCPCSDNTNSDPVTSILKDTTEAPPKVTAPKVTAPKVTAPKVDTSEVSEASEASEATASDATGGGSSDMGITTDTADRLEKKILRSIFGEQQGGKRYDDSSSSSSSSSSDLPRGRKHKKYENKLKNENKFNENENKNKNKNKNKNDGRKDGTQLNNMADNMEKIVKDIEKEAPSKAEKSDSNSSSEETEETNEIDTSNEPESGAGLSIFPFDSESNSYQNYRALNRHI